MAVLPKCVIRDARLNRRVCEGFRMPADRDLSNRTDGRLLTAGFRKPPRKEPAGGWVGGLAFMGI